MPGGRVRRRVYISSTFIDLKEHRAALKAALEQAGFDVASMERYPAFDERPLDYCLNDVVSCDAYVLLLAHRYGYRPDVEGQRTLSITEREYRHAHEQGKPCFVFCVDEEHAWPPELVDKDEDEENLARFRKRVAEAHGLRTFNNPDNLAYQVLAALSAHRWPETAPPQGSASATTYQWPAAWDFGAYIAEKRKGFEGRDWLFRDVAAWLSADGPSALLVRADFGVGKSAFMAELAHRNPGGCIAAWHFCQHDTQDTLHPGQFVRSVAAQLAKALPDYKTLLKAENALQERLNRALEDPSSAFEGGVLAPLGRLSALGMPKVLLVDALDEALELDAETMRHACNIVHLLATKAGRFPSWLRVLATTRSHPQVLTPLQAGFAPKIIDAESAENLDDLQRYVLHQAAREPLVSRLHEAGYAAQDLVELLIGKSKGKFLLAVSALQALAGAELAGNRFRIRVQELADLPPGMDSWYLDAFERRYGCAGRDYGPSHAVLGVLAAASEPLPPNTVAAVLGVDVTQVKTVHRLLPDLLRLRASGLAFDHFSLAQWLTREGDEGFPRAGDYAVDLPASQQQLRAWALALVNAGRAQASGYLLRHLAVHLDDEAERRQVYGELMLGHFEWLQTRLDQDGVDALLADVEYIRGLPEQPLLEAVLRNGAHVLRAHPEQLAAQVLARVGNGLGSARHLGALVASIQRYLADPASWRRVRNPLLPTRRSMCLATAHVTTLQEHSRGLDAPRSLIGMLLALPDGRIAASDRGNTVRVWDQQRTAPALVLEGHTSAGFLVLIVLPDGRIASGASDGTVRVWDMQCGACASLLEGHTGPVRALAVLSDGRIASGGDDGTVRVWDLQRDGPALVLKGHARRVNALAELPDGRIAVGCENSVQVWDPQCNVPALVLGRDTRAGSFYALAVLPDGRIAALCADDRPVRVWDPQRKGPTLALVRDRSGFCGLAVLPDGRIATGVGDGTVRVYDPGGGTPALVFEGHAGAVLSVAVLPDGRIASSSSDRTVRVWDPQGRVEPLIFEGHTDRVDALAVLPDGRIASGGYDGTVRVWDLRHAVPVPMLERHTGEVVELAVLPDGRIASGGQDGTVRVWDLQRSGPALVLEGHTDRVNALAVLPDGRIAAGARDGTVRVWDLQCSGPALVLEGHTRGIYALTVLPDGRLVSAGAEGTVRVWDLQRGSPAVVLRQQAERLGAVGVLPDGRVVTSTMYMLQVWDPQRPEEPLVLKGNPERVDALIVLPDRRIAFSFYSSVRVSPLQPNASAVVLNGHTGWVNVLALLPDGRIASGASDGTVRVWNLRHGGPALVLEGHTGSITSLVVLPDGRIASGAEDATVRVWNPTGKHPMCLFCAEAAVNCLVATPTGLVVAGCSDGAVHFLRQAGL